MPRKWLLLLPLLTLCITMFAQQTLQAVRIYQVPKIDGNLEEAAWADVPSASDFVQNFPTFGLPASQPTQVKVAYDNNAVYVGAYLFDDPALIRKQLTARDDEDQNDVDYFSIFFDTYNDKQNGFQFLVTSMNVQTDARLSPAIVPSFRVYGDRTWDAVWESNVSIKENGWVVEMRIPYIALRFSAKEDQEWGLQLMRFSRRNNEVSFWNPVNPEVNGFVNQFGYFKPLQHLQPPLRLSFSPYVSTGIRLTPERSDYRTEWLRSGGVDLKYGINESFTLDATLIPDFGQVISDNVVNNLTPYEIRFADYRPFFTEGTELFNKAGLFYSRRVGATPSGYSYIQYLANANPDIEIIKNPTLTQLYNAVKLSGRTKKKLGIGVFNAVTAPMHAIIKDRSTGEELRIETEPLANYNILVLDQSLKGRSYLTFTNTNVIRNGNERDANVSAFDFSLYNNQNRYNVRGTARYSKIFGTEAYDGFNTNLRAGKVSGNFQYYLLANIISDQYDPQDLGYLESPNHIVYTSSFTYNQFTPTKNFLNYNYNLTVRYGRLYNPNQFTDINVTARAFWYLKNFWDITLSVGTLPADQHDYFVLNTPGRFVKRPAYSFIELNGSSDSRKRLYFRFDLIGAKFNVSNKDYHVIDLGLRYRFNNKFSMEISGRREAETNYIVYAGRELNGEPIISFVDFTDINGILAGTYNFTSRLNLTLRARHYWSKVINNRFANVTKNGDAINRMFIPDQDQNVNIFNLDAFLTWDFRLGSRLIVGYKNWLGSDEYIDGKTYQNYFRNFGQTFFLNHGNEFTVRFIYFLDYNQLRKKK